MEGETTMSERTLQNRINRKLKADGLVVRKTRGARAQQELGDYYVLDTYRNLVVETHADLPMLYVDHCEA